MGIGASVMRASRLELGAGSALAADSSGTRRLATAVLDHEDVQRVRRAEGGTANDVLLAVVAGGLRRWLLERGSRIPGRRTACPGPRLAPPPRRPARLRATSSPRICSACRSPSPTRWPGSPPCAPPWTATRRPGPGRGAGAVALLADQLPPLAHRFGRPLAGNAARILFDVLVTSVPLPRSQLSLGGCPLRALYPMAPLARGQSLAVALSTYDGRVHIGLVADGKAVPDVDRLAACFGQELADLLGASAAR